MNRSSKRHLLQCIMMLLHCYLPTSKLKFLLWQNCKCHNNTIFSVLFLRGEKKSVNLGIIFKKSYKLGICIKFWEGSSPISLGSALRIIWLTGVVLICRIFPFSQKKLFQCTDHSPVGSNASRLPGAPWVHYFAKKYTPNQSCLLTFTYPEWRTAHQLWKNCKENKLFVSRLPPAPVAVPGGKCWNISSWLCLA